MAEFNQNTEKTSEEEIKVSQDTDQETAASETAEEKENQQSEDGQTTDKDGDAAESDEADKKKSKFFGKKEKKKDKRQMFDSGAGMIIEKILPVIDDFERGLAAMSDEEKETSFGKGMEMIYKKFTGILKDAGVSEIEAVGKEFDPAFHNAVMQAPSDEYESGIVVQELQKGYMFKEKVLRHSMVAVAE